MVKIKQLLGIPEYMHEGIIGYIEQGVPQGSFLQAIFENDLVKACSKADTTNIRCIPAYAKFLYNYAPEACWGSAEKVKQWMEKKNAERRVEK